MAEGVHAEAGGMRFPDTHRIINKYIDIFNLSTVGFSNMKESQNGLLYFDGKQTTIESELNSYDSLLARVSDKWGECIEPIRLLKWEDVAIEYCGMSVLDFLRSNNFTEEEIDGFQKFGIGLGAYSSIMDLSVLEILRLFVSDAGSKNLQLVGGMETLSQSFLNDTEIPLHSLVKYVYQVSSVKQFSDGKYLISSGNNAETYKADFVIVTAPLPALKHMTFDPPLEDDLCTAIKDTHYVQSVKVFIQTKTPFWLDRGIDGMIISDLTIQNTYFIPEELSNGKGLIIASYTWEKQAAKLFKLSDEEKIDLALEELSHIFPEIHSEFEKGAVKEWKHGFSIFKPGQQQRFHNILRDQALDRVFLAGEHCSVEHGYFEGALETGIRAAANVLQNIDAEFESRFESLIRGDTHAESASSSLDILISSFEEQEKIQELPMRDKKMLTLKQFRRSTEEMQVPMRSLKSFRQYESERHFSSAKHLMSMKW